VIQVAPFALEEEWVTESAGTAVGAYLQWMRSCARIRVTAHPALALPGGVNADGLPVGGQGVGRQRGDVVLRPRAGGLGRRTGVGLPLVAKLAQRFRVDTRPTGGTAVSMVFPIHDSA